MVQEHFRAFELSVYPTRETVLIELGELADDYPLADYFVGPLRLVTLKRYVHIRFVFFNIKWISMDCLISGKCDFIMPHLFPSSLF